jgi:hypothetical protein
MSDKTLRSTNYVCLVAYFVGALIAQDVGPYLVWFVTFNVPRHLLSKSDTDYTWVVPLLYTTLMRSGGSAFLRIPRKRCWWWITVLYVGWPAHRQILGPGARG